MGAVVKRSQFLKDLLAVRPEDTAAAAAPSPTPAHVKSGAARSFEEAIGRLVSTGGVVAVDPAAIDRADLADRMEGDDGAAFSALKASIAENGQEVPVLLRPHPTDPARYQTAYGHRRVRAARELGLQVKAVVRPMTDAELVLAQGLENSAREDLTFVEQARFAAAIEAAGHGREVAMRALSVDKTWLSRMLSVTRAVPADVVAAIGRAPGVGARRWIEFAEAIGADGAVATVRGLLADP
ncbi:plasmid partitioning protein RepB, partial [Oharaeibacter diazotrophicus]